MKLSDGIKSYLDYLVLRKLTPKHIGHLQTRLKGLKLFLGDIELEAITPELIQSYLRTPHLQKLARGTFNHYIAHCRGFFTYCHDMGYMPKNPAQMLQFVKEEQRIIEYLSVDEIKRLLRVRYPYEHNKDGYQIRDQLAFRLAIFCGLRSSEIRSLRWEDVSWEQKEIFIRQGKNLKDRIVPIPPAYRKLMKCLKAAYLARRGAQYHQPKDENEFVIDGYSYGMKPSRHVKMQAHTLNLALRRNLEHAKIKKKWPHMHMLRHTCGTMYVRGKPNQRGMDIRVVQELLGHTSIRTTEKYVHVDKSLLKQEMERTSPV